MLQKENKPTIQEYLRNIESKYMRQSSVAFNGGMWGASPRTWLDTSEMSQDQVLQYGKIQNVCGFLSKGIELNVHQALMNRVLDKTVEDFIVDFYPIMKESEEEGFRYLSLNEDKVQEVIYGFQGSILAVDKLHALDANHFLNLNLLTEDFLKKQLTKGEEGIQEIVQHVFIQKYKSISLLKGIQPEDIVLHFDPIHKFVYVGIKNIKKIHYDQIGFINEKSRKTNKAGLLAEKLTNTEAFIPTETISSWVGEKNRHSSISRLNKKISNFFRLKEQPIEIAGNCMFYIVKPSFKLWKF